MVLNLHLKPTDGDVSGEQYLINFNQNMMRILIPIALVLFIAACNNDNSTSANGTEAKAVGEAGEGTASYTYDNMKAKGAQGRGYVWPCEAVVSDPSGCVHKIGG